MAGDINPNHVWARFLNTINDVPNWNSEETYAVVRLPISRRVQIYSCTVKSGNCVHQEYRLIAQLRNDLGSRTGPYYVNIFRTSYSACYYCVKELDRFLKEMKQRNCVLILNYKITSVNGEDHQRGLGYSREFWKCGISDLDTPSLVLQSFDSIKDLLDVHTLIKSYAGVEDDREVVLESMKNVISKQAETKRRIQSRLCKFNRLEVFKAFHDSHLHGCEDPQQMFCALRFPCSNSARIYTDDYMTGRHAEMLMIEELRQMNWTISGVLTIYQNFTVCKECISSNKTGLIAFMTRNANLHMKIKAVGSYHLKRQSCIDNPEKCGEMHAEGSDEHDATVAALKTLKQNRVDLQSFRSYEDWRMLINLLNESDDCYSDRVEYNEYRYMRSRKEEDECANQDFLDVLG